MARLRARPAISVGTAAVLVAAVAGGCGSRPGHPLPSSKGTPSSATEISYSTMAGSFVMGTDGSSRRMLSTGIPFTADAGVEVPQQTTGALAVSPDGSNEAYWRDCDQPANGPSPEVT